MEAMGRLQKPNSSSSNDRLSLLQSSPNILENFAYEDYNREIPREMILARASLPSPSSISKKHQMENFIGKSQRYSETLERHEFMQNVIINTKPSIGGRPHAALRYSSPREKEIIVRRSLEEISKDIKEIEEFITATEDVMRREKEQEKSIGGFGNRRKYLLNEFPDKENQLPLEETCMSIRRNAMKRHSPPVTYKIGFNNFKNRRTAKPNSPRFMNSRLYFRNGKIGCLDAEKHISNIESTHALVKHIIQYEHEKPLVSPESVRRILGTASTIRCSDGLPISSEKIILPGTVCDTILMNNADKEDTTNVQLTEETFDNNSQPIVDEDEQDVQICYNELPDVPNDEKNIGPSNLGDILESEIVAVDETPLEPSGSNRVSTASSLDSNGHQFIRDQVRHLVWCFTARANKMKSRLEMPATPSSTGSSPSPPASGPDATNIKPTHKSNNVSSTKGSSILTSSPKRARIFEADTPRSNVWICSSLCGSNNDEKTLDPQGKIYISWLCVVSISFLYNAWVIPLRSTFPFQTKENTNIWLIADFCADVIYLLDVIFFKHRIMYLFEGFWVKNKNLTRKNYCRKLQFKLDLLALLPLELFYFKYGTSAVWLRFPRFFKIQSFWEVFKLLDRVTSSPHFVRVAKTLTYMLYMIHLTACAYYAYSAYQGLGINRWVFSGVGHPYVRCFSFATKTATSIGKNPKPEREGEFVFMTAAWLMGVFVFALLIGQIRDIISTATRNKNEYRQLEDETLEYMRRLNLPKEVQRRVKMWFKFTWDQQRTLDEANILDSLPINLKTDIAISVHIQTLSKVQLFADCEEALLRDLVLKLRAVTFLPGDCVCRKGEVGREMYIIKLGQVEVMGGPKNDDVLATLSEGSVFGEISLLGINGADRRTADVRSKGYANLFVLSKSDLNEVIAYYPNAQAILNKRARRLMRKNALREREEARSALKADVVIGNPKTPDPAPKLLKTVIQALPYESPAVMLITVGSKRWRKKRQSSQMETMLEDGEIEFDSRDSFILHNEKRSHSPDLLSSIQNELKSKHKFINLTDSEKALIISTSSNNSIEPEDDAADEDDEEEEEEEFTSIKNE